MASTKEEPPAQKEWCDTDGTGDRQGAWGLGGTTGKVVAYVGTILLLLLCPSIAIFLWFSLTRLDGSLLELYEFTRSGGLYGLCSAWPKPSAEAWKIIASFGIIQAVLQLFTPGKTFSGPISPKGNVPVYKANGVQAYFLSLSLFFLGWRFGLFSPARVYDLFGEILAALNIFSLLLCAALHVKGIYYPSSSDNGSTGSIVYDYFWGRELYPRIGKDFDIKTWTNCRMGMMSWAILPLCYAIKQYETTGSISNSMFVSVALMELYVFKFFLWETGYWKTMDIAHDRAGYYLCWGCLNWVPSVYTSQPLFLANHPYQLHPAVAAVIFLAGAACIYINWDSDRQRQVFRETGGQALVWGQKPKIIIAKYKSGKDAESISLLLASGYWGLSRHFHYVPEILSAVLWTAPAGFGRLLVWFYVIFLTLLLTDRSYRDDQRCSSKYSSYWQTYCKAVPYRMVPFVY